MVLFFYLQKHVLLVSPFFYFFFAQFTILRQKSNFCYSLFSSKNALWRTKNMFFTLHYICQQSFGYSGWFLLSFVSLPLFASGTALVGLRYYYKDALRKITTTIDSARNITLLKKQYFLFGFSQLIITRLQFFRSNFSKCFFECF